jgi:hypothetical protein
MTTYQIFGFNRENHEERVTILLDVDGYMDPSVLKKAGEIAGPQYCLHASQNLFSPVPDDCKGVLFKLDELYARLPELDLSRRRRRRRR